MRVDMRNAAAFVRDSRAAVTNVMLPLDALELELKQDLPVVEEHRQLEPLIR